MMNILKVATLAAALATISSPAMAQALSPAVIVIVDMDRVVNESSAGKLAATELQTRAQALNNRRTTLSGQLQAEVQAIQQGQENKSLAGPALEARVKAFQDKEQAANAELTRGQQDLGRAQDYVVQQISTAAQPAITQIMREKGAQVAVAERATIQHSQSLSITTDVIARVNASLPRVSTTPPAAPAAAAPAATPPRR